LTLHVDRSAVLPPDPTDEPNPYLIGPYEPVREERTAPLRLLEGSLPDDINGVYVRNGPNPQHAPVGRYHWFDGDGMVHAVQFADGRATYRNRWIRTDGFVSERDADRAIYSGILEPFAANPGAHEKDTANTDLIYHRDRLLALWYRSGSPYALDPVTLDTVGKEDFGGSLPSELSAHAKVDAHTGELVFFDYGIKQPHLRYGVVSPDGAVSHYLGIELPGPRLPHDMAITENWSILMDLPLYADPDAAAAGRHRLVFDRDLPSRFALVPRHGSASEVRWFEARPCYIYHSINAWEENGAVVMDVCRVKQPKALPADASPLAKMLTYLRLDAHVHRFRFDLHSGRTTEQVLDDDNMEFPSIRQDRQGRPTRYAYTMHISPEDTLLFDGLTKYDTASQRAETYWFGDGRWGSEAPFAPRPGSSTEDDGYLISYVCDERAGSSEVHILDAAAPSEGPVCRLGIPFRVPLGFHATWIDGSRLPGGTA
jgi:carotenoid cleavage dioxygenase-like enzyme